MSNTTTDEDKMTGTYSPDPRDRTLSLLWSISEPIQPVDQNRIVDCVTCDGATRTFDDPADCPDCGGARYVVL